MLGINVNEHAEKKEGLTYLSWAWAWAEVLKAHPDATYTVWKDERNLPYAYDPATGYMVYTTVTIEGITREMWLPVMDSKNKTMKAEAYTYSTKYGNKTVEPATMFDVNKAIMRCLTKNLAMFGLGLYIYAGEDLPDTEDEASATPKQEVPNVASQKIDQKKVKAILAKCENDGVPVAKVLKCGKVDNLEDLTEQQFSNLLQKWEQIKK